MNFKVGDVVECIIESHGWDGELGKRYIIEYSSENGIKLMYQLRSCLNSSHRFKLLTEVKENKMTVYYTILKDSMNIHYDGKLHAISENDDRYSKIIECIDNDDLDSIPAILEENNTKFNGDGIELKDGLLHVHGIALPSELNDKILAFKEQKKPYKYLLAFWENLKLNPSFNSRNMLFKFLEHNGHPFTPDGYFVAYRGVTNDFKDLHTKTFNNSPGSVCEMDRSLVDENPNNTCSVGLHVACHKYASDFGSKTVMVKVNPKDVVAVPTDYHGTKMRVCRFEVMEECKQELTDQITYDDVDEVLNDPNATKDACVCPKCGTDVNCDHYYCNNCGFYMETYRMANDL